MISSLELAKLCGVSQGTVDRALHGRAGISEKTKTRILALAKEHGYRPHPAARELLTGERKTIGALVPAVNGPFYMDLLATIRQFLVADGYRFFVTQVNSAEDALATLDDFAAMRARMAIVIPPRCVLEVPAPLTQEMEVIALVNPMHGPRVRSLLPDELETGRRATRYLLERGHRRIAHLTWSGENNWAVQQRLDGYLAAMNDAGQAPEVITLGDTFDLGDLLRPSTATAMFCHNDWLALAVVRSLNAAGRSVPAEVSVLGVDDSATFVSLCPDISTMHYPAEAIAHALRAGLRGEPVDPIGPAEIVERNTVRSI